LVVTPESQLKIEFKNKPYKNTMEANKWMTNEDAEAVKINNNSLSAPKEKGVYVYDISARWKQGSASYVFVIKVQSNTEHLSKNKNADIKDVLDTERFVQMLKNKGYEVIKPVKDNKPAMDSLLSVYPSFYKVNGKIIGIYEYKDEQSALKDSKRITKDGNIIGHGILEWVDKPNFYHRAKIIVSYIGSEFKFQNNLEAILGECITQ
jgi:hypothetical protein